MPITFLNSFERQQYQEIPQEIQEDVIIRFFYLTEKDMEFVRSFCYRLEYHLYSGNYKAASIGRF